MTEPLRFEPLEGRTPEGTLRDPMRRLCKFNCQCRICGKEHQAEFYVSLEAGNLDEYWAQLNEKLMEPTSIRNLVDRAAMKLHEEQGGLRRLALRARGNGLYEVSEAISVTLTGESHYTCDDCGSTFETIQLLREHPPKCGGSQK